MEKIKKLVWLTAIRAGGMFRNVVQNRIAASYLMPWFMRRGIYNLLGNSVSTSEISPHCFLGGYRLQLGKDTFISYQCFFDLTAPVILGEKCRVAFQTTFITSTHELGGCGMRAGDGLAKPIVIGNGVWIGARATILPGVTVGDGAVIGAGAVVVSDCEADCIYAGVPARKIRKIEE